MDASTTPTQPASASASGGTIEPANRAAVAKARYQTPDTAAGERYELRDPFAEVTYRANTLYDIVAKAEQIGSNRFVAVAEDGLRTPIHKVGNEWQRGAPQPARPERPLDPLPARDEVPDAANPEQPRTAIAAEQAPPWAHPPTPQRNPPQPTQPAHASTIPLAVNAAVVAMDAKAERAAIVERLEAALRERYLIKRAPVTVGDMTIGRTEYRFRGDTSRVAFTESTFRLATDTNSPSVARSMVDVAEARNWKALRVSGNEDFKRMVWLEASTRGVKTLGYEPNPGDLELLKREREARLVNRIEPAREAGSDPATAATDKASGRGGGRKAVLAAIEAVLVAKKVPEPQRTAVMAAATEQLAQRVRNGEAPKVKVYDRAAPSQRPAPVPTPELQRSRDRAAPAPVR